ncbi:MAG: DUF2829 domain-containing protein [Gammaproteobacteria bacterium]|nr:DUF2829 domain-containing protein [Gammaproteobacteria bacterium]
MNFGNAIKQMKKGIFVARSNWKGEYIYLQDGSHVPFTYGRQIREYEPVFVLFTKKGTRQQGWIASPADMLANDWQKIDMEWVIV